MFFVVVVVVGMNLILNAKAADGGTSLTECPKGGGNDIAIILWGVPPDSEFLKEEVKKKKIVLGGCIVSKNDPELECNDCGWRYLEN